MRWNLKRPRSTYRVWQARRERKKSTLYIPERGQARRCCFRPVVVNFYCLVRVKLCGQVYLHEKKKKRNGDNVLLAAEAALFPPISPYCDSAYAKRLL